MDKTSQLFLDYQNLLSPDTTGLLELKKAAQELNKYFEKSQEKNPEETYKLVASPIMGLPDNRDISDKEAFDTMVSHRQRTKDYFKNKDNPLFDKRTYADMLIKDFTNAFELDKKLLVRLVCINRILNDKEYDFMNLYSQNTGRLLTELDQSCNDWSFWTDLMDRRVRNAASHIDFYYDDKIGIFKGKEFLKFKFKGKVIRKINHFSISPETFMYETLSNAINASQSFWVAGILLYLTHYPKYYKKALNILN